MLTLTLKKKTKNDGHLVLDVPTTLIDKNVEVVITIQEQKDMISKPGSGMKKGKKYDFSHLYQKLEWKGDALREQKKIRSEWD
jgi:hypothetical protein